MHQTAAPSPQTESVAHSAQQPEPVATASPAGPSWAVQPVIFTTPAAVDATPTPPVWLPMLVAALATSAAILTTVLASSILAISGLAPLGIEQVFHG